jgi:hypothetical protein
MLDLPNLFSPAPKFALCHPWDMRQPSGETALSLRIARAARNIGWQCLQLDKNGYVLDRNYECSGVHVSAAANVAFVIHPHFASRKTCDLWSIFPMWNPPEIPYDWPQPLAQIENYLHHDDYLSSNPDAPLSVAHLNMLLAPHGRAFDNQLFLYPALPEAVRAEPSKEAIRNASRLFYVGMNWEKHFGPKGRHEGLFRKLDRDGCVAIYGPRLASGVATWAGFEGYEGEIPFDGGEATVATINRYGAALAISSVRHQRAQILTNRIYEAAAAGAVIVADRGGFIEKHFGDSVLQVDNCGDETATYRQVKAALQWIKDHPDQAYEKAARAQDIYLEKFTLEKNLRALVEAVPARSRTIRAATGARAGDQPICVVLRWYARGDMDALALALESINRQTYPSLRVVLVCDTARRPEVEAFARRRLDARIGLDVAPLDIFHAARKLGRRARTGEILLRALGEIREDYVAFLDPLEEWFSDHLSALKRALEDEPGLDFALVPTLKAIWRQGGAMIDDHVREFSDPARKFRLPADARYDNRIGRILFRRAYLDAQVASGLPALLQFLDQTEFFALTPIALWRGSARLLQRTSYVLHSQEVPARLRENWWSVGLAPLRPQSELIRTWLRGRCDEAVSDSEGGGAVAHAAHACVEDFLNAPDDETFIKVAHNAILGRDPLQPEAERFRRRLQRGKTRESLAVDLYDSEEGRRVGAAVSGMYEIARRTHRVRKFLRRMRASLTRRRKPRTGT